MGASHASTARSGRSFLLPPLAFALAAAPFLAVRFVPSTDLPQHLAQVRLWQEYIGWLPATTPSSDYAIQPLAPNNLVYVPLLFLARALPAVLAGKIMLLLLVLAWVAAVHALAQRRGRPGEAALLASLVTFNASLYWGFLNFLAGAPLFLLLLHSASPSVAARHPVRLCVRRALCALLCCYAHLLWFGLGALLLLLEGLWRRENLRLLLWRAAALAPSGIAVLTWYPSLITARRAAGFDVAPHWFTSILQRFSPEALVYALLGGLAGPLEPVVLVLIAVYVAAALWTRWGSLRRECDASLLVGGALCFAVFVFAPDKYANTILFNSRFAPYGMALALLALPRPSLQPAVLRAAVLSTAVAFSAWTALAWYRFERSALSGLGPSLDAISMPARVLGLDFLKVSDIVKGRPFLQTFAWFQAQNGGEGNFSFAEHASSIVRYRRPRRLTWTPGLEWHAERVGLTDLEQFDYLLLDAPPEVHAQMMQWSGAVPLVGEGVFRLYRLQSGAPQ